VAEGLPTTAAGWATHSVESGEAAWDGIWKNEGGKLPPLAEHAALSNRLVSSVFEAMLWEALRLVAPEAADRLAEDVENLCEAGDSFGELLYEWRERLAAGLPLSGAAVYEDVWERVGLTRSCTAPVVCESLGHETVPAAFLGTLQDGEKAFPNVAYCRECGEAIVKIGDYVVTRELP
jgi:hypothetical protein